MPTWTLIYFVFAMLIIYLIPTIIAGFRKHNNFAPILIVNLFTGWTFIGWFVAFVWCFTSNVTPQVHKPM